MFLIVPFTVENLLETPVITSSTEPQINSNQPAVRMKERNYIGMFEFKAGDESVIIKHLVWGKSLSYLFQYGVSFKVIHFMVIKFQILF